MIVAVLAMALGVACANAVAAPADEAAAAPEPQEQAQEPIDEQQEDPQADASESTRSLEIIRDCNDDGVLQGRDSYSAGDLERARRELASDVDQYSDCRAVISAALRKANKNIGGGSAIPVSAEQRARYESVLAQLVEQNRRPGAEPSIPIDGHTITPGSGSTFASTARPGAPLSLLLIIGLCLLAAIPGIYGGARVLIARRGWNTHLPSLGWAGSLRPPGKRASSGE